LKPEEERITLEALDGIITLLQDWGKLRIKDIMAIAHLSEEGAIFLAKVLSRLDHAWIDYDDEEKTLEYGEYEEFY